MSVKPTLKNGHDVVVGDVIAALEDASEPILAPMAGKIQNTKAAIIITPTKQSVVRYEIPGFKQLLITDGDNCAGQSLTMVQLTSRVNADCKV